MITTTAVTAIDLTYANASAWSVFTANNLASAGNLQANFTDIVSAVSAQYKPIVNSCIQEINILEGASGAEYIGVSGLTGIATGTTVYSAFASLNSVLNGASGAQYIGISGLTGIATGTTVYSAIASLNSVLNGASGSYYIGYGTADTLGSSYTAHLAEKAKEGINVLYPPSTLTAMTVGGVVDNTTAFQAIIDYAHDNDISRVLIPAGEYLIQGTITLKKNVQIIGVPLNYNAYSNTSDHVDYSTVVRILHSPTVAGTDLFVTDTAQTYGYISGILIANLDIYGSSVNSRYAFDLVTPANFQMQNVLIKRFDEGLRMNTAINCRFTHVDIQYVDTVCVRIHTGISTSTTFHNCYFHESPTPLIIEQDSALGVSFCDQTIFESCENGIDIYPGNRIDFANCYTEDIPSDGSAKAVLNLGINGVAEADYAKGSCFISGGMFAGYNVIPDAGSSIFNTDKWAMLTVAGTRLLRAGSTILKTVNSKGAVFIGVHETRITNGVFNTSIETGIVALGSNYVGTNNIALGIEQIKFNNRGNWIIKEAYEQTDSDLIFTDGTYTPLWLDAQGNIRHQYEGAIGNAVKCDVFGPISTPDFTGAGFTACLWAETLDGITKLIVRRSDGQKSAVGIFSGTTAQRPTVGSGRNTGMVYYDTTLGIPIYYSGADIWKRFSDNVAV